MKYFLLIFLFSLSVLHANEKVVLQLKWFHQFQFAGYYAAKEKGFYEEAGLDVTIRERDLRFNNITQVIDNEAQYGVSDSVLFLYMLKNQPIKIVAPIFQHSPNVLFTLKSSGLDSPYKLANKTITFYKNDTDGISILGMLKSFQIIPELNRIYKKTDYMLLAQDETDAYAGYLTNEPYYFKEMGIELNIINPANYGFDLYGDMLFTNEQEATNHPQRVEKFKKATLKGWEYALSHKEEMITLIHQKYAKEKSLGHLKYEADALEQVIQKDLIPLGALDKGRVKYILDIYKQDGFITTNTNIDNFIFEAYNSTLNITDEETYYLAKKGKITMCVDPDWMPFEKLENNKHIGMSADFFKIFQRKLEVPIEVIPTKTWSESLEKGKNRECDIFSLVMPTPDRRKYLDFTQSYIKAPLVIVTNLEELFIDNIAQLEKKSLGVSKGYAFGEILKKRYPYINFVDVENIQDGLKKVYDGKLYGFVGALPTTGYHIQKEYVGQLKIAGKFNENWELGIGVRNDEPLLKSIFNKAIATITKEDEDAISNKWVSVSFNKETNYLLILLWVGGVSAIFFSIILFVIRSNNRLSKEIQEKTEIENKLQEHIKLFEKLSITDELTGLYNRRHFNNLFESEYNRAKRDNKNIAFLMLDIDFFKLYNDNYGHQKGDNALKEVAHYLLSRTHRAGDFAFRLGGEEFGLLFSLPTYKEACDFAQSIQEGIEELHLEHNYSSVAPLLTASAGLIFQTSVQESTTDELYKLADDNLYAAKERGRNRLVATSKE